MNDTAPARSGDPLTTTARIVSDALSPAVSIFLICLVAGLAARPGSWEGLAWGLGLGVLCALVPMAAVRYAKGRSAVSDGSDGWKRKRWLAFAVSFGSLVLGVVLAMTLQAPALTTWALTTMLVGLAASTIITAAGTKVSMHAFCLISLLLMLSVLLSPWWLCAAATLAPLMLYSRVRLGEHTTKEVLLGAGLAAAIVFAASQLVP